MIDQPEQSLITRAITGDSAAFGELVRRHQRSVYNVCFRLMGTPQDAEDLAQEAFIRAHKKLHTFALGYDFGPWIRKIAANLCMNELKKHYRKTEQIPNEDQEWRFSAATPDPAAAVETRSEARQIRRAILSLPPAYRTVIELRHYQDLSYQEIASVMNIPLDHVRSHLFRARKKLARMLTNEI